MSNQHTPGPWRVDSTTLTTFIDSEGGGVVAECAHGDPEVCFVHEKFDHNRDKHIANARLIAASPTLLEAAAASIEAINQGEADIALIYLRHAVKQAIEGGAS